MIDDLIEAEPDDIGAPEVLGPIYRFLSQNVQTRDHHMLFLMDTASLSGTILSCPMNFPKSGITLRQLGRILRNATLAKDVPSNCWVLQACAMSGIEVLTNYRAARNTCSL
jgi:hypothetical protein